MDPTPPGMTPGARLTLRVLYLFAGRHRQADIGGWFEALVDTWNETEDTQVDLHLMQMDTLRGGSGHNLLDKDRQQMLLKEIQSGFWDIVIAAPPCNTYSRALFSDRPGPRPGRDRHWPDGFPWLDKTSKKSIDDGTELSKQKEEPKKD